MSPPEYPADFEGLRFEIGGSWSVIELAQLLGSVDRLYEVPARAYGEGELEPWPEGLRYIDRLGYMGDPVFIHDELRLRLLRIRHESPGFVDITGIGKAIEQVRLFAEKLIDLRKQREREGLENEYLAAQIQQVKTENLRSFAQALREARELGLNDREIRHLVVDLDSHQERLAGFIEEGKVTEVDTPPEGMAGLEPEGELAL